MQLDQKLIKINEFEIADNPASLFNKAGLPAWQFRTK
jgi:hypothetical protein